MKPTEGNNSSRKDWGETENNRKAMKYRKIER